MAMPVLLALGVPNLAGSARIPQALEQEQRSNGDDKGLEPSSPSPGGDRQRLQEAE
jgi:hypothetical protein